MLLIDEDSLTWKFIEVYFPDYENDLYVTQTIALKNILTKNGYDSFAKFLLDSRYQGNSSDPKIIVEYNKSIRYLLDESLKAFLQENAHLSNFKDIARKFQLTTNHIKSKNVFKISSNSQDEAAIKYSMDIISQILKERRLPSFSSLPL